MESRPAPFSGAPITSRAPLCRVTAPRLARPSRLPTTSSMKKATRRRSVNAPARMPVAIKRRSLRHSVSMPHASAALHRRAAKLTRARPQRALPMRLIEARPRLFTCIAIGIVLAFVQPHDWRLATRLLIAWNGAVILYSILSARMMMRADELSIRRRAQLTDDGKYAFLGLSVLAAIASFAAIVLELSSVKDLTGSDKALHAALVVTTIVSSC